MADFIFWGSKIIADDDCSHEIKRRLLLRRKVMSNLDKSRDIILPTKVRLVKAMVFPVDEGGLSMDTIHRGYHFNYAPVRTSHRDLQAPFTLSGEGSVVLETVKQGEDDGIVLRLYEALGATSAVRLAAPHKEMVLTNLLEDEIESLGRDEVSLTFTPFEIKTVKLK